MMKGEDDPKPEGSSQKETVVSRCELYINAGINFSRASSGSTLDDPGFVCVGSRGLSRPQDIIFIIQIISTSQAS
jgi:hypothetical protein